MTNGISSRRRRAAVSLSVSVTSGDNPADQLDHVVGVLHQVNRALPKAVLGRNELTVLSGFIIQISSALLALTDLLNVPPHYDECTLLRDRNTDTTAAQPPPAITTSLHHCRDGIRTAHTVARALHTDLRQRDDVP
jgi:hypothetical protein